MQSSVDRECGPSRAVPCSHGRESAAAGLAVWGTRLLARPWEAVRHPRHLQISDSNTEDFSFKAQLASPLRDGSLENGNRQTKWALPVCIMMQKNDTRSQTKVIDLWRPTKGKVFSRLESLPGDFSSSPRGGQTSILMGKSPAGPHADNCLCAFSAWLGFPL